MQLIATYTTKFMIFMHTHYIHQRDDNLLVEAMSCLFKLKTDSAVAPCYVAY